MFSPEEMLKLLNAATGDQLVAIAVGGFAGVRSEELKRLQWEHINFEEDHIVVPDEVAKCEARRIVPMSDNLRAWLLPFRCDTKPEYEIAKWRWLAETYTRLTDTRLWNKYHSTPSQPVKQDIFRLLLTWKIVGDVSEVLATTLPFEELSEDEARQILEYCKVIPAEFFGGTLAVMLRLFGIVAGHEPLQLPDTMFGTGRIGEVVPAGLDDKIGGSVGREQGCTTASRSTVKTSAVIHRYEISFASA